MPEDFDHARAEARHLIYEADINKVELTLTVYIVMLTVSGVYLHCE